MRCVIAVLLPALSARQLRTQRQKVLSPFDRLGEPVEQQLEVAIIIHKIDIGCIYHQQIAGRVVEEEMLIGLHNLLQVGVADRPLAWNTLPLQSLFEYVGRGLKVDNQIRSRDLLAKVLIIAVIESQLSVG